jgi:hypothetical protein
MVHFVCHSHSTLFVIPEGNLLFQSESEDPSAPEKTGMKEKRVSTTPHHGGA